MRHLLEYLAAAVVVGTLRWSPLGLARRLARGYAGVLDRAIPRLRRTAYANLARVWPEANARAVTDGVFASIGRLLLAFARFPEIDRRTVGQWIRYEGLENLRAAEARGKGVLIATGHVGNWELSAFAHALMSAPMHVVVRPLDNPLIDRMVERRRGLSGNRVIEKKDAARAILRALAAGECVGVLVDQHASPEEGVVVPFFGVPARSNAALVRFAHRTGAAVVPGFALWSEAEGRHVLRFWPEVRMSGDVVGDTAAVQRELESVIREYPDQWLWVHRRWK